METHVFERKVERHGGSIPQRQTDSNPKPAEAPVDSAAFTFFPAAR
jgi:hypothetical protein